MNILFRQKMQTGFLLASMVLFGSAGLAEGPEFRLAGGANMKLTEKLNTIIIPLIHFREASLTNITTFLSQESQIRDSEKVGVNILLLPSVPPDQEVTIFLRNVPLIDALKYITQAAGLRYYTMSNTVLITTNDDPSNRQIELPNPENERRKQKLTQKLNTIVIPIIRFREAEPRDIAQFIAEQSKKNDPENVGINTFLASGVPTDKPPITLSLDKPTLNEVLQKVTEQAGLKFRVEPSAVAIYFEMPKTISVDGVTYEEIRWDAVTPATIKIFHRFGVALLPLAKLPPVLQWKFSYDPDKAAEYLTSQAEAKQRAQETEAARRQQTTERATEVTTKQSRDTLSDIKAGVKARAQAEWPNNYDMQVYTIKVQMDAYQKLQGMTSASGIPSSVFEKIKNMAIFEWPDNYDMQVYTIEVQTKAYRDLQ